MMKFNDFFLLSFSSSRCFFFFEFRDDDEHVVHLSNVRAVIIEKTRSCYDGEQLISI